MVENPVYLATVVGVDPVVEKELYCLEGELIFQPGGWIALLVISILVSFQNYLVDDTGSGGPMKP